jgi:CheY-like chemotaxis protein
MTTPAETYVVSCHACQATFDALDTPWCSCLVTERTLVCPACLACFCKAKPQYKQAFWRAAPRSLWDRKLGEHQRSGELPENPPPGEAQRPMVLLVDDEKDIQRVAFRVLEALGYGVVLARNGVEGLELARLYRPDLVLTDALMPKLDGREMSLQIKSDPVLAGIKTVVMTALYKGIRYESEAYKNFKVDGYLAKPLDVEQLSAVLKKHLG